MKTVKKTIKPYSYESTKFNKKIFVKKHNRRYHIKVDGKYRVFNMSKKDANLEWLKDPEMEKEIRRAVKAYKKERETVLVKPSYPKILPVPPLDFTEKQVAEWVALRSPMIDGIVKEIDDIPDKKLKYNEMFKELYPEGRSASKEYRYKHGTARGVGRISKDRLVEEWKKKRKSEAFYMYLANEAVKGNALPTDYFYLNSVIPTVDGMNGLDERFGELDVTDDDYLKKAEEWEYLDDIVLTNDDVSSNEFREYLKRVSLGFLNTKGKVTPRGRVKMDEASDVVQRFAEIRDYSKKKGMWDKLDPKRHFDILYHHSGSCYESESDGYVHLPDYASLSWKDTDGKKSKEFNKYISKRMKRELGNVKNEKVQGKNYGLYGRGGRVLMNSWGIEYFYKVKGYKDKEFVIADAYNLPNFEKGYAPLWFDMCSPFSFGRTITVKEKDIKQYKNPKYGMKSYTAICKGCGARYYVVDHPDKVKSTRKMFCKTCNKETIFGLNVN